MEFFRNILQEIFAVDSIWSIIFRGAIWLLISMVILISIDNQGSQFSSKKLKSSLGFFLMFLMLSGTLIYLLFGVGLG